MNQEEGTAELASRLRQAAGAELAALVEGRWPEIDVAAARQLLRNPYVTSELIGRLAAERRLAAAYELRRDVVAHPATPRVVALEWVGRLHWPDLLHVGADARLHPLVRRAADQRLLERLPSMALGEKMAVARSAGPSLLATIRADPSPRVIAALLDNPRLTEPLLAPLLASETALPPVLAVIAASPRWGGRYGVRLALARNPRTPGPLGLVQLPWLKKPDLLALAADPHLALPLRQRARLLAGGDRPVDR